MPCCDFFRSIFTWIRCLIAILTFSLDLVADVFLGFRYYTDYWGLGTPVEWAIATWVIALAPGVINTIFNFCFLCQINPGVDMPKWTYSLGYIMSLALLGPPWHHLVTMTKTCEINVFGVEQAEKLAAIQRTIQAMLQSLPQLFFQIYIVSTINTITPLQGISMLTSLLSFINASFITIRSLNRKFHFGASDMIITVLGTVWICLLLLSGVPSIALFAAEDVYGPAFSALLIIVFIYLLVLPLVVHTKTVFWKIISAFFQLIFTFTMATTLSLWYFNKKDIEHSPDSCNSIVAEVATMIGSSTEATEATTAPSIFTTENVTMLPFLVTTNINNSTFVTTDEVSTALSNELSNVTAAARLRRDVEMVDDTPILNLDETHCLSDWSLVIVIGVASANALFFFYHMVLILAVRLRQQVAISTISSPYVPESRVHSSQSRIQSPGSLVRN